MTVRWHEVLLAPGIGPLPDGNGLKIETPQIPDFSFLASGFSQQPELILINSLQDPAASVADDRLVPVPIMNDEQFFREPLTKVIAQKLQDIMVRLDGAVKHSLFQGREPDQTKESMDFHADLSLQQFSSPYHRVSVEGTDFSSHPEPQQDVTQKVHFLAFFGTGKAPVNPFQIKGRHLLFDSLIDLAGFIFLGDQERDRIQEADLFRFPGKDLCCRALIVMGITQVRNPSKVPS